MASLIKDRLSLTYCLFDLIISLAEKFEFLLGLFIQNINIVYSDGKLQNLLLSIDRCVLLGLVCCGVFRNAFG